MDERDELLAAISSAKDQLKSHLKSFQLRDDTKRVQEKLVRISLLAERAMKVYNEDLFEIKKECALAIEIIGRKL